jgi:phosphatidyl-myo-inositol dimannoside synthase
MRVLALVGDAFGGWGGIAKFNRDFLGAIASHAATTGVVVVPRHVQGPGGSVPAAIEVRSRAARGPAAFATEVARLALFGGRFDAIVCGHINLGPLARIAALRSRAPVLLVIHGIDAWAPTRRVLANVAARHAEVVIAVSRFTLSRFASWAGRGTAETFVLPNAVTLESFGPGPKSDDLVDRHGLRGRTVLLSLARLDASERYKGIDEVMRAIGTLKASIPNIVYLVAGDGTDRPRLEVEARRLGVEDRVVFAGRIAEERKADYYRLADAFVMPGRGEGFGIVYLEALASGVPVVGSILDGSRDALLDGRLGILVNPDDPEDVVRGIAGALASPRGVVPSLLAEFSGRRFEERVHELLDATVVGRGGR